MYPIVFNQAKKNAVHLTDDENVTLCGTDITPVQKDDYQYLRVSHTQHAPTCGKCIATVKNMIVQHMRLNQDTIWDLFNDLGLNK